LTAPSPVDATGVAGLVYVSDTLPGWRRLRRGNSFRYVDEAGRKISDAAALQRIRSLAIPPAYEDVWICPLAEGHLQATGRDAKGRKQYRYHPAWHEMQGQLKYERLRDFGRALGPLRIRVSRDLQRPGLPREKVLAAIVRLLDTTYLRVGNHEYARTNGSFGVSTLRTRHASVKGSVLEVAFRGKSGVSQRARVEDPTLARIVRRCQDLPGQLLFQYLGEDRQPHPINSADVNAYIREATNGDFTAKDFRTWHASTLALDSLWRCPRPQGEREAKRQLKAVIGEVASRLGHTVTVCRKSYVHSAVIDAFECGALQALDAAVPASRGTKAREARLLALLDAAAAPHSQ
jgi:DNA topoisomerase-1